MTETPFNVGTLIESRYRILTVIGSGGMGTLYRVSDEARSNEILALKTVRLKTQTTERAESAERFQREFQLLTQLRHPNLVSVYNFGITTNSELYFTMEWIEGEDLEPKQHPLEPAATIPVMIQVCRALAYLHARGVIHGDLKPQNILMTGDAGDGEPHVKIVDFGLAHEIRSSEDRARYYTPGYTAPEARHPHPIDHRTDLYSLGAMWFALLVGEPPMFMPGAGRERLIRFALDEALEGQGQIPKAVAAVIARLMATSPDNRYASANEVIEAVNEITGNAYQLETQETASSYALRTHFVNREEEIEALQTLWEQAKSDEGKLVLIGGEGGVGKTRLVAELEVQAELEGARVVWGQCVESGGSAYHPWREVLRVLVRYVEDADKTTMQRIGPVLTALLLELWNRDYMQELEPPADLEPQAARQRLNDAIIQVLHTAAKLRPTVVVIENAHWADEASLEMLRFLARIPGQTGLLTCVTYRDDEVDADHLLEQLAGEWVQRVRVRRLSPEVTTELVRSMLGLEQLPALLTERVQQTTGGNAFFVQELIRSLATEGEVLRRTVGGWQVDGKALQEAQLPESIRQVVWRRMGQLSAGGRQALSWAAVMGTVAWEKGIAEVGQVAWQRVRVALREGLEQGLVVVRDETSLTGEREYIFLNPTVWEVSYEGIPREERQENHSRAAAWLMARSGDEIEEHLGLIANHLERAGQTKQAADYLRRAGEQAAAQFANAEAVAYFSHALELTAEDNQEERYALLLEREKVYDVQGAREAQDRDLAALEEIAQTLADNEQPAAERQAEVSLRRANYAEVTGDYPAAIAAAQKAIELAQDTQDTNREAAGYLRWGWTLWRQGDYDAARLQLDQALNLSRAAGVHKTEADSLSSLGFVCAAQGAYDQARAYYEQALPIYRQVGDRRGESYVLNVFGVTFAEQADYDRGRTRFEQALSIYREIGDRWGEGVVLENLGWVLLDQGHYDEARIHLEQALRICREIDNLWDEGETLNLLGSVFLALGDYSEAQADFEQALHTFREIGNREGECWSLSRLCLLFHGTGDDETARTYCQQALSNAQEIASPYQGNALTNLGHVLMNQGHLAEATERYQQALTLRREWGQQNLAMDSAAGLARAYLAQGDLPQAQAQVEEILSYLEDHTLDGAKEPFRVYLTCYRVLHANQDPRAPDILHTAHRLLQERAANIGDEETRRSFLENVTAHQEIVREFVESERQGAAATIQPLI
jgi:predicted ATPase